MNALTIDIAGTRFKDAAELLGFDTTSRHRGKVITTMSASDDTLTISFEDGSITLTDDGQSCCERRYMTVEDDLTTYVGSVFLGWMLKHSCREEDDYGCGYHDIQFLEVLTSVGSFTVANHNAHNGHYGGFQIQARDAG